MESGKKYSRLLLTEWKNTKFVIENWVRDYSSAGSFNPG